MKLSKSGDTAKGVGHRVFEYINKKMAKYLKLLFYWEERTILVRRKQIVKVLLNTETAQKLLEKSNVKRFLIYKVPPRLESEANDLKGSHFNQLIADFVTERNNENLVIVETVNKEIKNFNSRDLTKLSVGRLSALFIKNLVLCYQVGMNI